MNTLARSLCSKNALKFQSLSFRALKSTYSSSAFLNIEKAGEESAANPLLVFNPDLRGVRKIKRLSNVMKKKYNTSIKSLARSTNMMKKMVEHIEMEHGFHVRTIIDRVDVGERIDG